MRYCCCLILVCLVACTAKEVRCDLHLQPINAPAPKAGIGHPKGSP
jgi:hypothetical protein